VVEARGDARLVEEHLDELVLAQVRGQDALDDDELVESPQAAHAALKDLGHPPHADPGQHGVLAEPDVAHDRAPRRGPAARNCKAANSRRIVEGRPPFE
jgi:hypothetical protein